jgi:hypothetical protein
MVDKGLSECLTLGFAVRVDEMLSLLDVARVGEGRGQCKLPGIPFHGK